MRKEIGIMRIIVGFGGFESIKLAVPHVDWIPSMDAYEYEDRFLLLLEVPGVGKENISISFDGNLIRISGYRKILPRKGIIKTHQMEISSGYFEKLLEVYNVDPENIEAELKDGILYITLKKL